MEVIPNAKLIGPDESSVGTHGAVQQDPDFRRVVLQPVGIEGDL